MKSRSGFPKFAAVSLLTLLSFASVGCATHNYRYYDRGHSDYHYWDNNERSYYGQWTVETHRDSHRDFRKLNKDEQDQYWNWRHNHPNN